jgi:hypothetical protein
MTLNAVDPTLWDTFKTFPSLYSQQRLVGINESTLFNHIHKHSFGVLIGGRYTDFLRVYSFGIHFSNFQYTILCKRVGFTILFFSKYFHKESTLSLKNPRKPIPFLMNTALYPCNVSTWHKEFSPNYF